jgi:hypothetical protein
MKKDFPRKQVLTGVTETDSAIDQSADIKIPKHATFFK